MVVLLSASLTPPSEELRPIRIGAMAVQPQPDQADRVYVGRASMLPADLRALCSCTGLFYVQIIREVTDGLYRVAVAALPGYFSADAHRRTRHVRPHMFSDQQMAQLLEWDRSLAAMETGDVQGLLAAKQFPRIQQQQDTDPEQTADVQEAPVLIDVDLVALPDCEGIILPLDAVRNMVSTPSHPALPTLLLQAVLRQLRAQHQSERRFVERQAIKTKERRIRQVYQQRDRLPLRTLVQMTPIYGRGTQSGIIACRVDIDLPAA